MENINQRNTALFENWENYLYVEQHWKWWNRLSFVPGIRFSNLMADGANYVRAEPRLNTILQIKKTWFVNTSYAMMNQYLHQITNMGFGLPIDFWMPVTKELKPQRSQLITL